MNSYKLLLIVVYKKCLKVALLDFAVILKKTFVLTINYSSLCTISH